MMKVVEKLGYDLDHLIDYGPITIVAFGDSVTHGAVNGYMNYETVYWNRLKKKLNAVKDYVPVNVIDAGIAAVTAYGSIDRMEKQVIAHNPDLVIVCFGLNDVNQPLGMYIDSLRIIFDRCRNCGADVIFMTPNMMNTYVADDTADGLKAYAEITAEYQKPGGKMDVYMDTARALCHEMGVTLCDCYAEWKKLAETEDVTMLLANRINHPSPEMHELFADMLFKVIFADQPEIKANAENGMYRG